MTASPEKNRYFADAYRRKKHGFHISGDAYQRANAKKKNSARTKVRCAVRFLPLNMESVLIRAMQEICGGIRRGSSPPSF